MKIRAFTLVFVWLNACGGGGGGGSVAPDQIGAELGGATCERLFECCDAEELMEQLGLFDISTVEECTSFFAGFVGGFLGPQIDAAVASGRLVYHGDRMADCVAGLRALPCDELAEAMTGDDFLALCANPFEGQVGDGGACGSDLECQSATCTGDSMDFEGNVIEGACGPPPGAGDACDLGSCGAGLYCEFDQAGEVCAEARPAGSSCLSDDECVTGNCDVDVCSAEYSCDGQ
jgi:hypothetical protein